MRGGSPGRLRHRVGEVVAERKLWPSNARVAVAVSGGLDSVALLDILCETASWHGGRLSVVTVDHGTREGSAADADFVEELAGRYGLGVTRVNLALGDSASELLCRQERYAAFAKLSVDRVALGHHADDQAETVLLQLIRGAGTKGLGGMRWRRGPYVRPLLGSRREELARWAEWRGLTWREDPTNSTLRFQRNRLRHEVMPVLEKLRPGCTSAIARAAESVAMDSDLVDRLAEEFLTLYPVESGLPLSELERLHEAVRRRVFSTLGEELAASQLQSISAIVVRGAGAVELGKKTRVEVLSGCLLVCTLP